MVWGWEDGGWREVPKLVCMGRRRCCSRKAGEKTGWWLDRVVALGWGWKHVKSRHRLGGEDIVAGT